MRKRQAKKIITNAFRRTTNRNGHGKPATFGAVSKYTGEQRRKAERIIARTCERKNSLAYDWLRMPDSLIGLELLAGWLEEELESA